MKVLMASLQTELGTLSDTLHLTSQHKLWTEAAAAVDQSHTTLNWRTLAVIGCKKKHTNCLFLKIQKRIQWDIVWLKFWYCLGYTWALLLSVKTVPSFLWAIMTPRSTRQMSQMRIYQLSAFYLSKYTWNHACLGGLIQCTLKYSDLNNFVFFIMLINLARWLSD